MGLAFSFSSEVLSNFHQSISTTFRHGQVRNYLPLYKQGERGWGKDGECLTDVSNSTSQSQTLICPQDPLPLQFS